MTRDLDAARAVDLRGNHLMQNAVSVTGQSARRLTGEQTQPIPMTRNSKQAKEPGKS